MTLIIGCITKDFGIIVGDTQLSVGDLNRGRIKKEVKMKVSKYGNDFMMGILGKWSWFYPGEKGTATYIDDYNTLQKVLLCPKNKNKTDTLNKFLNGRENIDASTIYVNRNEEKYELNYSTNRESSDLKRIQLEGKEMIFNEPFFHYDNNYIEKKIINFHKEHNLNDTLTHTLFLLNNICLEIISEGNELTISKEGVAHIGVTNSVGGYVTIQIMNKDVHYFNCLFQPYIDKNVLLDKTTHPFSIYVNNNKVIRYIDNLAMLVKSSLNENISIYKDLIDLINMQCSILIKEDIIDTNLLNNLIDFINDKYKLDLQKLNKEMKEEKVFFEFLLDGDDHDFIDYEYLKRFF
jgi:hypothetical protein